MLQHRTYYLALLFVVFTMAAWGDASPIVPAPVSTPIPVEITGDAPYGDAVTQAASVLLESRNFGLPGPLALERVIMAADDPARASATVVTADAQRYSVPLRVSRVTMVPGARDDVLLISNKPERIPGLGTLCEWDMTPQETARLLYHHVNDTPTRITLSVELVNLTDTPTRVQIIKSTAGPSHDELATGHRALRTFLDRIGREAGAVITIPASSAMAPIRVTFSPRGIVSGLAQFRLLSPEASVVLRVRAHSPSSGYTVSPVTRYSPSEVFGAYRYRTTQLHYEGEYVVGGNWLIMSVGDDPVPAVHPGQDLAGSYGVWHTYRVTVSNPDPQPVQVVVRARAAGGVAHFTYSIGDDAWRATGMLRPHQETTLHRVTVPAASSRVFLLRTMPESGSNYPIRLTVFRAEDLRLTMP